MTRPPGIPPELWGDDNAPLPAWLTAGLDLALHRGLGEESRLLSAEQEAVCMLEWTARPGPEQMPLRERAIFNVIIFNCSNLLG